MILNPQYTHYTDVCNLNLLFNNSAVKQMKLSVYFAKSTTKIQYVAPTAQK